MNHEERRQAGLLAVRRVREQYDVAFHRPRCSDCRFGPVRAGDRDRCEHFTHWEISPDRRLRIPVTTEQARSESGLCGPDALLFEPYGRFRRIARWLARQKPQDAVGIVFLATIAVLTLIFALAGY